MKIINSYLAKNDCYIYNVQKLDSRYTNFQKNGPKGIMLHSVGCAQPSASVFVGKWNKSGITKCVHAFIDANTGDVYQCLPWNYRGWHGGGSSNNTHIGIEMCEPSAIQYKGGATFVILDREKAIAQANTAYDSAVELYALLCKQFNLNPLKDIVSHSEGYKLGIASGHNDPEHLWRQLGLGYTMDTFRQAVNAKMGICQPTPQPAPVQTDHVYYTVQKGDTLSKIGKMFGVPYTEIAKKNNIVNPNKIYVGQKLLIK